MAITGFKHGGLKRFFRNRDASKLPQQYRKRIERVLEALNSNDPLGNLDSPGYRLHPLKGDLRGLWSVTVTGNRRITFRLRGNEVYDVDWIDYHKQ